MTRKADPEIRPAHAADMEAATTLLRAAGLPADDLSVELLENFLVATSGTAIVGMIGLEPFQGIGLLRSLVVGPGTRGRGVGRLLVAGLEARARRLGLSELWLLTIDADPYFSRLGYRVQDRGRAPEAIRGTAEFSTLCPGDAVLMMKMV